MNAAEHIVQTYLWEAYNEDKKPHEKKPHGRRYFTISNVIGGNNREIDILAISGDGEDRLRIECEIAVNWYLSPEHIEGRIRFKMIDDVNSRKLVDEIFRGKDYRKVFVVWNSPYNENIRLPEELVKQRVEVWSLVDLLQELLDTIGTSNYQDDISRFASMLSAMLSMSGSLRRQGCNRVSADVHKTQTVKCVDAIADLAAHYAEESGVKTVKQSHVEQAIAKVHELAARK